MTEDKIFFEREKRALDWVRKQVLPQGGVVVSHRNRVAYPEVTGYLIPTLLRSDEKPLALSLASWLPSVQLESGAFPAPESQLPFAFDTGQAVRGLVAALDDAGHLETSLRRACDWLIESSTPEGRLPLPPNSGAWNMGSRGMISEGVHLYVLPALAQAAEKLGERRYADFVATSLSYYLRNVDLSDFSRRNMLTHFYVYIQEALFDLGLHELCRKGMAQVAEKQWENGGIPAYADENWVCVPGLAQAALTWGKLREEARCKRALQFLGMIQNPSGGFFGSYGPGAGYFVTEEISWAVKYFLDAVRVWKDVSAGKTDTPVSDKQTDFHPEDSTGSKTIASSNLDPKSWHSAITGETKPQDIAERMKAGSCIPWVQPLLDYTRAGERVLELGSGTGELAAGLGRKGRKMTLVDFSGKSLEFGRLLLRDMNVEGSYIQADVCEVLPFADKCFDCVYSSGLLEHFERNEMLHIIGESARVSRDRVISLVPNARSLPYRLGKWIQEAEGNWNWGREVPFTTLRDLYEEVGLIDIVETTVSPEHALRFLHGAGLEKAATALGAMYRHMMIGDLEAMEQGYLLLAIGRVDNHLEKVPGKAEKTCDNTVWKKRTPGLKRLVIVPNDPLEAYERGGYGDLTSYFNPRNLFDEVYCVSPQEVKETEYYGVKVIPTPLEMFADTVTELGTDVIRVYDLPMAHLICPHRPREIPLIVSVHDVNPGRVPGKLPQADAFLAISGAVKEFLVKLGAPENKILDFANRVDTQVFFPVRDGPRRKAFEARFPGRYRLLHVGRMSEQKNPDTLIKAVKYLGEEYSAIFVGAGNVAPYRELAQRLGVADQCHFIEMVPNHQLAEYYCFCDCMCTPSRWEGFGIVFIEALACGAVVVTSDIPPMNEYITSGSNGFLVKDYENAKTLADTIQKACCNEGLRKVIKARARQSVSRFDRQEIESREAEIYSRTAGGIRTGSRGAEASGPADAVASGDPVCPHSLSSQLDVVPIHPDLKGTWNEVVDDSPDAWLYHTYEWQELLTTAWKAKVLSVGFKKGSELRAILPLVMIPGGRLLESSFGPAGIAFTTGLSWNEKEDIFQLALKVMRDVSCREGVEAVRMCLPPLSETCNENFNRLLLPAGCRDCSTGTYVLDFRAKTPDEIWSQMKKKWRYDIRKAGEMEFEIVPARSQGDIDTYYHLHLNTYGRTGVRPHPKAYFDSIWHHFGQEGKANFLMARHGGNVVAVDNIAVFKNRALYWTNASSDDYLRTSVNKLLQWEAIKWAFDRGVELYEVGEGFPDAEKGSKLAGLDFFKRSFCGELKPFPKGLWWPTVQ